MGFSSVASARIMLDIAPLTLVTVTDPGYGRSFARPPNSTTALSSCSCGSSAWIVSV